MWNVASSIPHFDVISMKTIAAFSNFFEAQIAHGVLGANDFCPMEIPQAAHCSLAGADQFYYIHISDGEADAARELLVEKGYERNLTGN